MKIISWNIDSLNAALTGQSSRAQESYQVLEKIKEYLPDIIAIQETKLPISGPSQKHKEILNKLFPNYEITWRSSIKEKRKSYAGVLFLYKKDLHPHITKPDIDACDEMDEEGRIITLEFSALFVTQVYTPNSGIELARLSQRQNWDKKYQKYLQELDKNKPVIAMGDFNVAHKDVDLKHPERFKNSAGFTDMERRDFTQLLASGFTDAYRYLYPNKTAYSWWDQRIPNSKKYDLGWRIDYFLVSNRIADNIKDVSVIDSEKRRDHAPIMLNIDLKPN